MAPKFRILIIDDEEGLRVSLAAGLELEGYEVLDVPSGKRAIECVRDQPFDLVITDMKMPGMNGLDTFRELRKIRPGIIVMLMTAFSVEGSLEEAMNEGVYTVVHKPFAMETVVDLIHRAIERRAILVIDNDAEASDLIAALRDVGIRGEAVHDGASVVRLVRDHKVDVCVLDLVSPGVDGVEICEEVHRLDPTIPIVVTSGDSVPEMMHRIMSMGGYACLRKPLIVPELVRVIAQARGASVKR